MTTSTTTCGAPGGSGVQLGATEVAPLTMEEAVRDVMLLADGPGQHLVVTPNADHLVLLERDAEFARAYAKASLRTVDGAPLMLLARLLGTPLPQRITGVDLTSNVLEAAERRQRSVFFLGGAPPILQEAVASVRHRWPALEIRGSASPWIDLDRVSADEAEALAAIRETSPDLLVLFLGAPKQEKWFWRRASELPSTVALAVGGTVDFIAGAKQRAPAWVQAPGCEWLWRMAQDPKRLGHRYLVRDRAFFGIAARQLRARRAGERATFRARRRRTHSRAPSTRPDDGAGR